jgi:hypothetical protein
MKYAAANATPDNVAVTVEIVPLVAWAIVARNPPIPAQDEGSDSLLTWNGSVFIGVPPLVLKASPTTPSGQLHIP